MAITRITEAEAAKDFSAVLNRAEAGEVVFIERANGRVLKIVASVVPTELSGQRRNLVEALSMPDLEEIEFDPPRSRL